MTVQKLPATLATPMHKQANRGLMVHWINADLLNRCANDVRKSYVFYDSDGLFTYALRLDDEPSAEWLQKIYDATPIRYYSKGI